MIAVEDGWISRFNRMSLVVGRRDVTGIPFRCDAMRDVFCGLSDNHGSVWFFIVWGVRVRVPSRPSWWEEMGKGGREKDPATVSL